MEAGQCYWIRINLITLPAHEVSLAKFLNIKAGLVNGGHLSLIDFFLGCHYEASFHKRGGWIDHVFLVVINNSYGYTLYHHRITMLARLEIDEWFHLYMYRCCYMGSTRWLKSPNYV